MMNIHESIDTRRPIETWRREGHGKELVWIRKNTQILIWIFKRKNKIKFGRVKKSWRETKVTALDERKRKSERKSDANHFTVGYIVGGEWRHFATPRDDRHGMRGSCPSPRMTWGKGRWPLDGREESPSHEALRNNHGRAAARLAHTRSKAQAPKRRSLEWLELPPYLKRSKRFHWSAKAESEAESLYFCCS